MRLPRTTARSGMTLVEVLLGLALTLGIGGTVVLASGSLATAFRTGGSVARLDERAHQAIVLLARRLETARPATLVPLLADPVLGETRIDFEPVVGYLEGEPDAGPVERIALEASPADAPDGVDNDGDGLVDELEVVWIERPGASDQVRHVVCRDVARVAAGEVPGNGLDDNGDGLVDEAGFALVWDGRTITVRLTTEGTTASTVTQSSYARTVAFLNSRED